MKFKMYEFNEMCSSYTDPCPLEKSLHFHCNAEEKSQKSCGFITKYGHLMDLHIQSSHNDSGNLLKNLVAPRNNSAVNEESKLLVKASGTYFPTKGPEDKGSSTSNNTEATKDRVEQLVPPSFPTLFSALHFAHLTRNL
uniref:Uncharacterized protein n=1 Tax=Megaselia scalaris TaxID=36166 RepID=T1GKV8_MEGSC